jgi:two-component system response regulator AtoC
VKSFLLVLTVIRNAETRSFVRMVLEGAGHRVVHSSGYEQAQSLLSSRLSPDLVLLEPSPPEPCERARYGQVLKSAPAESICLITGVAEQELRKEASELGVKNFLTKPVTRDDLDAMIEHLTQPSAKESRRHAISPGAATAAHTKRVTADLPSAPHLEELGENRYFLAASPAMLKIHQQAKLLADVDLPVLILGESGTGKEVIARLIHKHSRRSQHKLLKVNCAALPAALIESELFGYQRGAFTGAIKDTPGKFEQANQGTLFLDEIGEMSAQMQAKLLQVLQDGQFARLGGRESSSVDVRVLAATNIQMETALLEKTFREDLYYRLSVFTIVVPPLRERPEEIPYLIEGIIRRTLAEMKNGSGPSFSSRLMDVALLYDWPGNVRELNNFVTRTLILKDLDAATRELETKVAAASEAIYQEGLNRANRQQSGMRSIVRDVKDRTEAQLIQEALEISGWNRRHAAKYLNISYRGLLYKIQRHRLKPAITVERSIERFREKMLSA